MLTVITYDICDNSRRSRISKLLEDYGFRVQFSVFESFLERKDIDKLQGKLEKIIDKEEDKIKIYTLNDTDYISLGKIETNSLLNTYIA